MPNPTARQSHIDTALTNISIGYKNAAYIFDRIFPIVPVAKQTDKFFKFTKADWFRDEVAVRAPGTRAARANYSISTDNYVCVERALSKQVTDDEQANADAPLRPMITATEYVTDQLLKKQEIDVLDEVFGTGWSSSATPSTLWSDDTSDPKGDIEAGMVTVAKAIGAEPNKGVIGRGLWRYVKDHPDIVDRLKGAASPSDPARVLLAAFAALVELDEVLVARSIVDSALEGATSSLGFVAGNHMALLYVTRAAALATPSAGYVFQWQARQVNRYREDQEHADVVEVLASWDTKLTATDAGYLLKSAA